MEWQEMKSRNLGGIALAVWIAVGAAEAHAQSRGGDAGPRRTGGMDVEAVMALRDRLELTDDQLTALEELRAARVVERSAQAAEMAEMRSRLRAGQIPRSEMMAFIEGRREASAGVADERRAQIEAVLDETQRESLGAFRDRGRSFARGRSSERRDGMRGSDRRQERSGHRGRGLRRLPGDADETPLGTGPR
jgi:hypothetical protein